MMHMEIVTDPLAVEDLRQDLRINIELLKKSGVDQVQVLFGFSWGKSIYEKEWTDLAMSPEELADRVTAAETNGFGRLGNDNLYITIPQFSARLYYTYETDIHLSYAQENDFVKAVKSRWTANQWLTESLRSKTYQR